MSVGDRIKKRRIELGLTQEELARKMGYKGKTSVCVAETGGDNVTTTKVKKFADALGVSVKYLMGWEKEIPPIAGANYSEVISPLDLEEAAFGHADLADSGHAEKIAYKDYDIEEVRKAMELWLSYEKADPNIRSAVETLLKPKPQES